MMAAAIVTTGRGHRDDGAALVLALIVMVAMFALATAAAQVVDLEQMAAGNDTQSLAAAYAADAALERAIQDLAIVPDWTAVLAGARVSPIWDDHTPATTSWGTALDLAALTIDLQARASTGFGTNTTRWRLFLSGPLSSLVPDAAATPAYLVAWAGDDQAEIDGDPWTDANQIVRLHACAVGPRGLRADREATLARDPETGVVRVVGWRSQ